MLALETLRAQATEATFPLHALQVAGKTIGLVRDAALPTLPFSQGAYVDVAVESLDDAVSLFNDGAVLPEISVKWCARVTFSVSPSSQRHGLIVHNLSANVSSSQLLSSSIGSNHDALDAALSKMASQKELWATPPSKATSCSSLHVYFMSEPPVSTAMSSTLNDLPLASAPHVEGIVTTRVVVGDTPADIVAALRAVFSSLLAGEATQWTGTEVCWPRELTCPVNVHTCNDARRRVEHAALLLPNKALLHHQQSLQRWSTWEDLLQERPAMSAASFRTGESWERHLVTNPHTALASTSVPSLQGAETLVTSGSYDYYHYRVDGFRDDGWGCAYRSLQTVLSWFQHAGHMTAPVPSLRRIQELLYATDPDKAHKKDFIGSCDWIGSFEIMLVLQHFMPGLDCTIKRLESGRDLESDTSVQLLLREHFRHPHASPVMIGGSSYAHTILGIHVNVNTMEARYLILDPHYSANPTQLKTAMKKGYVGWKEASTFFEAGSWYNLCIPRTDLYDPR